ncbi:Acyl-CoA-dependent acyltransferase MAC2 [Pseudozyma hubeiensis]|nr:Acyl-CoA-dependent acyltransferase MAC2 [Pseudozyma hubeiensis]
MQAEQRAWKVVSPTTAQRPLVGVEKMLNYAEYYQNGNFQLSVAFDFETNVSHQKLRQRFGLAVWVVRSFLPELGMWTTTTSNDGSLDLDHVTFTALQSVDEAQAWLDDTATVVDDGTTAEELMNCTSNHRIEPPGKQFRVYLILNPRRGSPSIILNASHAINGHRAHVQCCSILEAMMSTRLISLLEAVPDPRLALGSLFAPEDVSKALGKLPISLNTAYQERFKPTEGDLDAGMEKLGERLTNSALPTIGVPRFEAPTKSPEFSLGTANGQPMTMLNLKREMDLNEYSKVRKAHKKLGITVPSFVYACIVNSIDRRCQASTAQDDETPGANLAYSAHASRWFPAETFGTRSPVNMAIVPGSSYIAPHELRSEQRGRDLNLDELIALSKTIRQRQEAFLTSPHIISTLEQVADEVSASIAETASKQQQAGTDPLVTLCENSPAICPPTLTSQGDNVFNRLFTAKGGSTEAKPANLEGDYIYVNKGYISGRTTDATVCFALLGFGGVLSLAGHFDSRFFDAKLVDAILDDAWKNLRAIAATVAEEEREAKL